MSGTLERLRLRFNPFEPAASGVPMVDKLWVPDRWAHPLQQFLDTLQITQGPKAYAILGEYGSGKTYLLRWMEREELSKRQIRPFFFDNPGVQFYDLANSLLRQLGREEFAKSLWEFLNPSIPGFQSSWVCPKIVGEFKRPGRFPSRPGSILLLLPFRRSGGLRWPPILGLSSAVPSPYIAN
jgi:hypothetical protein